MKKRKIELKSVSKKIKEEYVLKNISITFKSGKIYGIKGKNGSGKTMLFRMICGFISPTKGTVLIDAKALDKKNRFIDDAGVLIEHPGFLPDLSGFKNLKILADLQGNINVDEIESKISLMGLDPKSKKKFRKYSLGMRQRLGLAQALMGEPSILILDEPMNGLDKDGISEFKKILINYKEKGALILVASHDVEDLEFLSDIIITMKNGEIEND